MRKCERRRSIASLFCLCHDRQLMGASMQNVKLHCVAVSFAAAKSHNENREQREKHDSQFTDS